MLPCSRAPALSDGSPGLRPCRHMPLRPGWLAHFSAGTRLGFFSRAGFWKPGLQNLVPGKVTDSLHYWMTHGRSNSLSFKTVCKQVIVLLCCSEINWPVWKIIYWASQQRFKKSFSPFTSGLLKFFWLGYVSSSTPAAMTKCHRPCGLNNRHLFSCSSGGWTSEIGVPAWMGSGGSSMPALQMAAFSLCPPWQREWELALWGPFLQEQ